MASTSRAPRAACSGPPASLLTVTERRLPALIGQLRAEAPDYLIHDSMCAWGKYAARITGLPAVCTVTTFAFGAGNPTGSPMFRRRIVRLLAGGFADVLGYLRIARRLQRTYGIRGAGLWDAFANREPLNLVFTSRDFQPGGDTFDPSYRFVGPSLAPRGDGAGFSVGAREGQRVIYVSMGTIVARQEPFFRGCFEAFGGGAHRVVLSTGRSADISALGPIPANFLVRSHVPQLEVLERADLFITHGGMNSVHEGLCSGVPMIVIPRTAEQGLVAERVVAVGAGILLEARKATPDRLSAAAAAVLADSGTGRAAGGSANRFAPPGDTSGQRTRSSRTSPRSVVAPEPPLQSARHSGHGSADRSHPEVSADLPRELIADLCVSRNRRPLRPVRIHPPRVAGTLSHQGAAVRPKVSEKNPTIHTVTFSSWYPSCASRSAASRLIWIASASVTCSVSRSSSRLSAWQLTPGTSSIQPIQDFPSCLMIAV